MKQFKKINNKKINILNRIIYVELITIKESEIKLINFIGLCIFYRKKNSSFALKNVIKKENVMFTLNLYSPLLRKITKLNIYRKKQRLKKLYN